ncbi:TPA: hypothetical protein SL880_006233 [Pseudomonas aeruginosa]|nr:hypothetical protein [Pseudomonas aeruginosa]HEJ6527076.1 hypothetical protein [Pseudomonas aeruginosa]
MIAVATAKKWNVDRFSKLEQEGYKKFPYYYQIYFSAFDYHSPMWNGNQNDVEKFANMAVAYTAEKDKGGMYARVYWYASQRYYGNKLFTESDVTWEGVQNFV